LNRTLRGAILYLKKTGKNPIQESKPRLLSKMDCVLSGL